MKASARQQSRRILLHIIGYKLIDSVRKTDYLRSHIIDEHRAVDAARVHELEKSFGRAAKLDDLLEIRPVRLHQFKRMGLEHFHGLDVDVAISDHSVVSG